MEVTQKHSQRAAHDAALIDELIRRDLEVSAIYDGTTIKFANLIAIDRVGKAIVLQK